LAQLPPVCPKCGSNQLRQNGHSQGCAQFHCNACNYRGRFNQKAVERAHKYEQVEQLLLEHNSPRSIHRLTGVSRPTIAKLTKKASRSNYARHSLPALLFKSMSYGVMWAINSK